MPVLWSFGKPERRFLIKLKTLLLYDLAIVILALKTYVCTKTSTWMFISALALIGKTWKQQRCLLVGGWVNKLCNLQAMQCDPVQRGMLSRANGRHWRTTKEDPSMKNYIGREAITVHDYNYMALIRQLNFFSINRFKKDKQMEPVSTIFSFCLTYPIYYYFNKSFTKVFYISLFYTDFLKSGTYNTLPFSQGSSPAHGCPSGHWENEGSFGGRMRNVEGGCLGLHMWRLEINSVCLLQSLTSVLFWGHGLSLNLELTDPSIG